MAARLALFLVPVWFYWFMSLMLASLLKARQAKPFWNTVYRVGLSVGVIILGASPLLKAIFLGHRIFVDKGEYLLGVGLGLICLVATVAALRINLRAPQIEAQEFKRLQKQNRWRHLRLGLGGIIIILGLGALAWLWGRQTGMRALDEAAAQARAVLEARQRGGSVEAAEQYEKLFAELAADKELQAIPATGKDKIPKWPEGEELSRLVNARRDALQRLAGLTAGPVPAFELSFRKGSLHFGKAGLELRQAGRLLDLAAREAAARGDGVRVIGHLRTRLAFGAHAESLPTTLGVLKARVAALPSHATLGLVLPALEAGQRNDLVAYAQALAAKRRSVAEQTARGVIEDAAASLAGMHQQVHNPDDTDEEGRTASWSFGWFFVPLYGDAFCKQALTHAQARARIMRLPFARACAGSHAAEEMPRDRPALLALMLWSADPFTANRGLRYRANAEQGLGAREAACALRLYALDNGRYPESLAELSPKYIEPILLDPEGPVRLAYKSEPPGCRLTWLPWVEKDDGIQPVGDESEIAIGVPPTPPSKLKKRD